MTTTKTADGNATLQQMASLVAAGVDIVRVAVPHREDAEALKTIAADNIAILKIFRLPFDCRRQTEAVQNHRTQFGGDLLDGADRPVCETVQVGDLCE